MNNRALVDVEDRGQIRARGRKLVLMAWAMGG